MADMYQSMNPRQDVLLRIAFNRKAVTNEAKSNGTDNFGINTFNDKVMRERLPKDAYRKLRDTISKGEKLDMSIANTVAHAMKEWAISKGVSHFTHWFQPQTGLTAEKHDAFLELDEGETIERFQGSNLRSTWIYDVGSFKSSVYRGRTKRRYSLYTFGLYQLYRRST